MNENRRENVTNFCFKTIYRITKCERLIEFYSKYVRMTNFTFFFFFYVVSLSDGNVFSNEIDVDFYRDVEWN